MTGNGSAPTAADRPAGDATDSQLDSAWTDSTLVVESAPDRAELARPVGRLALITLLVAIAVLGYALEMASWPSLPIVWRAATETQGPADGKSVWVLRKGIAGDDEAQVRAFASAQNAQFAADVRLLPRSARWIADDSERREAIEHQEGWSQALAAPVVRAVLSDGRTIDLAVFRRGLLGLGIGCWLLLLIAAALAVATAATMPLVRTPAAAMALVLAASQSINLGLTAAEAASVAAWPPGLTAIDLGLRTLVDLGSAAAFASACALSRRPPGIDPARWAGPWVVAVALMVATVGGFVPGAWWITQASMLGAIVLGIWWLRPQTSREPRPYAALLRRLSVAAAVALAWLTLTLALVGGNPAVHVLRVVAPLAFVLFTIALLMLVPIALRTQALARETALLAGAGTLAASLHLLVAARLEIGPAAAAVIGVTAAVVFYAFVRRAVFAQIEGSGSSASGEQMFESLYRAARDFERDPTQAAAHLKRLLRELFEPLEIAPHAGGAVRARVSPDGSTLVVPLPRLPDLDTGGEVALRLRLARHGSRLFTREDARLAERVMEQLRRAVTFDRAIEQGRTEERMRIAQDLHDDIGARLLTLMYKAHDPEIEEYLRHTLQDLKTLTRGLAASSHPLSDAAAEWKADLTQRLAVTNCEMTWSFSIDRDWILSVTQWSALTRILRELVNNIIAHAQATEVEIVGVCERGRLVLLVSDDGIGRQPASWSHGLGLGGVRKRAKALGGEVSWQERAGRGIRCELRLSLQTGGARTRPRGA